MQIYMMFKDVYKKICAIFSAKISIYVQYNKQNVQYIWKTIFLFTKFKMINYVLYNINIIQFTFSRCTLRL